MPAAAADTPIGDSSAEVSAKQTFEYDTNPLLRTSGQKALSGSITSPEILFNTDSPTSHADLDSRVDVNRFDLRGFSSNDVFSAGHLNTHGQTWQTGLTATLGYDTTRTSETTASGINVAGIRHLGIGVQPQASVNVSPLDVVQINGSYQRSYYENDQLYTNYENFNVSPSLQHAFSPLDSGEILLQAGRYQSLSGSSVTADNIGPAVGWTRRFSERLTISGNVGAQDNMFRYAADSGRPDRDSVDYTFGVTVGYQGQQDTINFNASRQPSPNGNGSESQTTSFTLEETHRVTQHFEANLLAAFQQYDYTGGRTTDQSGFQSQYATVSPKLLYHLTESLSADVTYQYRQRETGASQSAQGNILMVNLVYRPTAKILTW